MVLTSDLFTNYHNSSLKAIPDSLKNLLDEINLKHYQELYEPEADSTTSLQDDLRQVLILLSSDDQKVSHLRYLWMTFILIVTVEPTLDYYDSNNLEPTLDYYDLNNFLPGSIVFYIGHILYLCKISDKTIPNIDSNKSINSFFQNHESYFKNPGVNTQAISEALDVFYHAIRVLEYDQAVEAILEMLYDCLEGYAIFPGSYGRRELFNWWLLDVVPASYNLSPPQSLYVLEEIENKEEIQLDAVSFIKYCLLGEINVDKMPTS